MISPGQKLQGRYLIRERIGKGGFSIVYRAEDLVFDKMVAVKVISLVGAEQGQAASLLDEARQMAAVQHPNIVSVDNFGVSEEEAYLVMPFADGGALQKKLEKWGQLPYSVVGKFLEQIGAGLDFAHSRNILHRDLKPHNVLMFRPNNPDSDQPEVYWDWKLRIADFGLAIVLSETSQYNDSRLAGTAAYMAPEQFERKARRKSDIYALGVMLYYMLSGEQPFKGSYPIIMHDKFFKPFPQLADKRPDAPPELQTLIEDATARQPEDRIGSCAELVRRYNEILEHMEEYQTAMFPAEAEKATEIYVSGATSESLSEENLVAICQPNGESELAPEQLNGLEGLLESIRKQPRPSNVANLLEFSPNGQFLAVGFSNPYFEIGALRGGSRLQIELKPFGEKNASTTPGNIITALAFDEASKQIVTGEQNGRLRIWDVRHGAARDLGQHDGTVSGVVYGSDGEFISASYDGTLWRWRSALASSNRALLNRPAWALGLVLLPYIQTYLIVSAWDDGIIQICQSDGSEVYTLVKDWPVTTLATSKDGRWLAAAGEDGRIRLWQNNNGKISPRRNLDIRPLIPLTALAVLSGNAPRLAFGNQEGGVTVLDMGGANPVALEINNAPDSDVAVRNLAWVDKKHLLASYYDGTLVLLKLEA